MGRDVQCTCICTHEYTHTSYYIVYVVRVKHILHKLVYRMIYVKYMSYGTIVTCKVYDTAI